MPLPFIIKILNVGLLFAVHELALLALLVSQNARSPQAATSASSRWHAKCHASPVPCMYSCKVVANRKQIH